MSFDIDTSELLALARDLGAANQKVESLSTRKLDKIAAEAQRDMQSIVPRRTDELHDSITIRKGRGWRNIGATARHAIYVEYGTSDTPPQPYVGPVAAGVETTLVDEYQKLADPFNPS